LDRVAPFPRRIAPQAPHEVRARALLLAERETPRCARKRVGPSARAAAFRALADTPEACPGCTPEGARLRRSRRGLRDLRAKAIGPGARVGGTWLPPRLARAFQTSVAPTDAGGSWGHPPTEPAGQREQDAVPEQELGGAHQHTIQGRPRFGADAPHQAHRNRQTGER